MPFFFLLLLFAGRYSAKEEEEMGDSSSTVSSFSRFCLKLVEKETGSIYMCSSSSTQGWSSGVNLPFCCICVFLLIRGKSNDVKKNPILECGLKSF